MENPNRLLSLISYLGTSFLLVVPNYLMPHASSFLIFHPIFHQEETFDSYSIIHIHIQAIKDASSIFTILLLFLENQKLQRNHHIYIVFPPGEHYLSTTSHFREDMAPRVVQHSLVFVVFLLLSTDSSFAEKPLKQAIIPKKMLHLQEEPRFSSPSTFTTQLDDIPIIQPTTPTGTPNTFSPTPFPPSTTTPTGDPTTLPPPSGFTPNNPTPFPTGPSGPTGPSAPTGPSGPTGQGQTGPTGPSGSSSSGGSWCVASQSASETSLQVALDYACGYGGADCSPIQPGASCYNPNTVHDHASYAFNAYYQKNPAPTSCSFGGVAQLTNTDPSSGGCQYPASKSSSGMPPPAPPMPSAPTTPTMSTPINPYPTSPTAPGGFTDQPGYTSSEPTGEPSSADSIATNTLLPLMLASMLVVMNRAK
ncbi:hypothetical protein L1987_06082 [Smallanthus sonchifolius]|uniref:Uncharacterized protein n=1 Tax=Smallanthus sonchifolius TaxID=185202 RepID=A0ACB9JXC4_9ASTR|nr:hypothetical protein L1987_06082 [Smallanthus sonchifolius]